MVIIVKRADRVSEEMKKQISVIIRDEIRDPRIPLLVSVTGVKTSRDLSHATIYISIYGTVEEKTECMTALKGASAFIRREVSQRMSLRISPELTFLADDTIEKGIRISKLIDEAIQTDREKKSDPEKS
jgi:ribosome-binding factor A